MESTCSKLRRRAKAKLRDWLFADYRWITRALVRGILCCQAMAASRIITNQHCRAQGSGGMLAGHKMNTFCLTVLRFAAVVFVEALIATGAAFVWHRWLVAFWALVAGIATARVVVKLLSSKP